MNQNEQASGLPASKAPTATTSGSSRRDQIIRRKNESLDLFVLRAFAKVFDRLSNRELLALSNYIKAKADSILAGNQS